MKATNLTLLSFITNGCAVWLITPTNLRISSLAMVSNVSTFMLKSKKNGFQQNKFKASLLFAFSM